MRLLKIAGRDPDGNAKPFSLTDNGEALVKESSELSQQIEDIKDKDFATETTLSQTNATLETIDGVLDSILAKIIAAPATAAKQDAAKTVLDAIAGKDFATQTTLAAILAKLSADPATQTTLNALKTLFDSGNAQVQLKGSLAGLAANRPVATSENIGYTYWSVDTGDVSVSTGTTWRSLGVA